MKTANKSVTKHKKFISNASRESLSLQKQIKKASRLILLSPNLSSKNQRNLLNSETLTTGEKNFDLINDQN